MKRSDFKAGSRFALGGAMTTTEHAAAIRAGLKRKHRWSSRQISVRAEYFSLGSSIRVEIKDAAVPLKAVKAIASQAERIHRDEGTGEILEGGNRYVSVHYSQAVAKVFGRRYVDAVQRAINTLAACDSRLEEVEGTPFLVGRPNAHSVSLWDAEGHAGCLQSYGTVHSIAETIGALMVERTGGPAMLTAKDAQQSGKGGSGRSQSARGQAWISPGSE